MPDTVVHRGLSRGVLIQDKSPVLVKFYPRSMTEEVSDIWIWTVVSGLSRSLTLRDFVEEVKHMSKFEYALYIYVYVVLLY